MQEEWVGLRVDARLALHHLHHPDELDGVVNENLGQSNYEGPAYQGKPMRVFPYYGVPSVNDGTERGDKKLPAMVLIHGGGGTAFDRWVKLWNSRGFAAIAMDLCGCVPVGTYGNWQRHEMGGPPGWDASFGQLMIRSKTSGLFTPSAPWLWHIR